MTHGTLAAPRARELRDPGMPLATPLVALVMFSSQLVGVGGLLNPLTLCIALLLAVFALHVLSRPFAPIRSPGYVALVLAFVAAIALSIVGRVWDPLSANGMLVVGVKLLLSVLLVQVLDRSATIRSAVDWFMGAAAVAAVAGIAQSWIYQVTGEAYTLGAEAFVYAAAADGTLVLRATGFSTFADQFAQPLCVAANLGVFLGFSRTSTRARRRAYWIVAALCYYAVWLAISRASWAAIASGLIVMPLIAQPRHARRYLSVLGALVAVFVFSGTLEWLQDRAGALGEKGLSERVVLLSEGVRALMEHPWNGVGIYGFGDHSSTPERYPVHNAPMQAASELGLPGLAVFLAVIAWLLVRLGFAIRLAPDARSRAELQALLAALIGLLVMMQSGPIAYAQFVWIYFALCESAAAAVLRRAGKGENVARSWIAEYSGIAWRRRGVVALTAVVASGTALSISSLSRPVYEAVTEFYVAPSLPPVGRYSGNEVPLISVLEQVLLPTVGGGRERMFEGLLESEAVSAKVREAVQPAGGPVPWDAEIGATRTHLMRIRVLDRDPERSARVANAYPEALQDFLAEVAAPHEQMGIESAEQAVQRARAALEAARGDLQAFLEQAETPDLNASIAENVARRSSLERELQQARISLQSVESRIVTAEDRLRRESNLIVSSGRATRSAVARRLMAEISETQEALALARANGEPGPEIAALDRRLQERKASLASEMETLVTRTQKRFERRADSLDELLRRQVVEGYVDRAALEAEIAAKTQALELLESGSGNLPSQRLREEFLRAEVERYSQMVDASTLSLEEARAQVVERSSNIVVVGRARPGSDAIYPLPGATLVLGLVLGLAAGVYVAFALEYWTALRRRPALA